MMDANLKSKWIEALRSGEYRQAHGTFESHDGAFCCLGVLCKVAEQPTLKDCHGNWSFASDSINNDPMMNHLYAMNDDGKTFPEIANYIEQNL